jgi:hypothetical protein
MTDALAEVGFRLLQYYIHRCIPYPCIYLSFSTCVFERRVFSNFPSSPCIVFPLLYLYFFLSTCILSLRSTCICFWLTVYHHLLNAQHFARTARRPSHEPCGRAPGNRVGACSFGWWRRELCVCVCVCVCVCLCLCVCVSVSVSVSDARNKDEESCCWHALLLADICVVSQFRTKGGRGKEGGRKLDRVIRGRGRWMGIWGVCVCVFVCICVCIYVQIYIDTYVHICMYAYMHPKPSIYVCMCVCMYVCMHACICMYVCMYVCIYVCM